MGRFDRILSHGACCQLEAVGFRVDLAEDGLQALELARRNRYDVILNLHWERPLPELGEVEGLLLRHARRSHCASQRASENYSGTDLSYWLLLRDPDRVEEMLSEVRSITGVSRVTSLQAEEESEV